MKRCIIITAYNPHGYPDFAYPHPEDVVICADTGYLLAKEQGIHPHIIIGDFDSAAGPECLPPEKDPYLQDIPVLRMPREKDDTDTMLCVKHGLSLGIRSFLIVGGIGGRLDHTLANLQILSYLKNRGADGLLADPTTRITLADPGTCVLDHSWGSRFSLLAVSGECRGITLAGAKYPLENAVLTDDFPLGISNEFLEDQVMVSLEHGRLLIVVSIGG